MKRLLITLLFVLSVCGTASAQITQGQCKTCTNGYVISLNGDTLVYGTMTFLGSATVPTLTVSGITTLSGGVIAPVLSVTTDVTLTSAQCGGTLSVTAAADTHTTTLPTVAAVGLGCDYTFSYVGANGGALVDISPAAADGINGGITLAASVVYFNGTVDNDIGLTKATGKSGDFITISSCAANMWCVQGSQGIWANN